MQKQIEGKARRTVKEDKPVLVFYLCLAAAILGYIFWNRDGVSSDILFGVAAMFAFFGGMAFALLIKDVP